MGGIGGQVRERKTEKKSEEKIYSLKRELLFRPFKILYFLCFFCFLCFEVGDEGEEEEEEGEAEEV